MILPAAPVTAVMHEVVKGVDARVFACFNLLGFAFVFFWMGSFDDPESFDQILWPMLLFGFFLGSFFAPLTALALHGLPPGQIMRAAEEAGMLRIAAGAFGIALQGVMLFRRGPFHQLHLADQLGGRRFASLDLWRQATSRLESAGLDSAVAQGKLASAFKQHAAILALNDAFLMACCLFLGLAALVWLAHPTHLPLHPRRADELREIRAEELMDQP